MNDDDAEGVAGGTVAGGAAGVSREVAKVATNMALADHIGRFVAGEVSHKFASENLADRLKGKNAIHVSVSWG
jgi:hypothetical protein